MKDTRQVIGFILIWIGICLVIPYLTGSGTPSGFDPEEGYVSCGWSYCDP